MSVTAAEMGDSLTFPKEKVEPWCDFLWVTDREYSKGKKFAVGSVSLIIDLKNSKNELEERAFIYLECKGKNNYKTLKKGESNYKTLKKAFKIVGTECSGYRMAFPGADRMFTLNNSFLIYPDKIELISPPGTDPLIFEWDKREAVPGFEAILGPARGSTFTIFNNKSFIWTMLSGLSGRVHTGSATCKGMGSK